MSLTQRELDPGQADRVLDALKSSADIEFYIAERLAAKARQAFALAAGLFTVAQAVALGTFNPRSISSAEQYWILALAIVAVVAVGLAALAAVRADGTVVSGDLPLAALEDDLNAAYDGDREVVGRLGSYYLGVVRTRRVANSVRRTWYRRVRACVVVSVSATLLELILSLIARMA